MIICCKYVIDIWLKYVILSYACMYSISGISDVVLFDSLCSHLIPGTVTEQAGQYTKTLKVCPFNRHYRYYVLAVLA